MRQWLVFTLVAALVTGLAVLAYLAIVIVPFAIGVAKRDADSKLAFEPLGHLRPIVLDNGFGVYHVEFDSYSTLADDNVHEVLTLNRLPAEYDLTLWLKTPAITDASIPVLSQLLTTDTIVLDGAGLTVEGIARLSSANPRLLICSADGKRLAPK